MSDAWHIKNASTKRDLLHQATIAARQDAKLRFFRKREAAAHRQLEQHNRVVDVHGKLVFRGFTNHGAIVQAISTQQRRNRRLGIA